MVFPKKLHWCMIFLVLSGKMIFLFPGSMILFFRQKMKYDLSQKNTWKYGIFCKFFEKVIFPKKWQWNMIFLVLLGKMIFLFPENMILFFRQKMRYDFSQKNTWKYDIFCKFFEKVILPKKIAMEYNLSCIIRKGDISFSRKYDLIL